MTSITNTVAMTTLALHTLQPHIFYRKLQMTQELVSSTQLKSSERRDQIRSAEAPRLVDKSKETAVASVLQAAS